MIGIVGDSNSGKSTLLNALLGQKLLPQSYKSCTSTVTLASLSPVDVPRLHFVRAGEIETVEGKREIHSRIKLLNEEIRGLADLAEVTTLSLAASGRTELVEADVCDGQVTLVDMPGQDESDNPVVKQCLQELLARCHGLFIMVKHDAIKSDRLAVLVDRLATDAPHLFRTSGAVNFVISHADTLRFDDDEADSDEWEVVGTQDDGRHEAVAAARLAAEAYKRNKVLKDLKKELRKFLSNRDCLLEFPSFVNEVEMVITSINSELVGGFEFDRLLQIVGSLHRTGKELRLARRVAFCQTIHDQFCDLLKDTRSRYPARAEQVKKAFQDEQTLKRTLAAVSAISFAVTIPLGGWGLAAGCAIRLTVAGAALVTGAAGALARTQSSKLAELKGGVGMQMMLRGDEMNISAEQMGAVGAEEANKRIEFDSDIHDIDVGRWYEDTLLLADGSPLYIGGFVNNLPEGRGRLFWPSTNYECFIGDFEGGVPKEGLFFNEKGFLLGRMRLVLDGLKAVPGQEHEEDFAEEAEW